ncbi:MAG TPA: amidohydrolase, partial [Blastocatellia bacterium]|nr:amidohydrolase [Blastocatellia bacterium]
MKRFNAMIAITLMLAMSLMAFAQTGARNTKRAVEATSAAAQAQPRETLIRNATILTASHGTIKNGSILIRDGKIAAVGTDVKAGDANARVIDATGKFVTP